MHSCHMKWGRFIIFFVGVFFYNLKLYRSIRNDGNLSVRVFVFCFCNDILAKLQTAFFSSNVKRCQVVKIVEFEKLPVASIVGLRSKIGCRRFFRSQANYRSNTLIFRVPSSTSIIQFTIANILSKKYTFIIQKTSLIVAKTITMILYKKRTINLANKIKKFPNMNT